MDDLLHVLRVRGRVDDDGGSISDSAVAMGFAVRKRTSVILTPTGRAEADVRLLLLADSDQHAAAIRAYEGFGPLNIAVTNVCNDWQVKTGGVSNDHRDQEYDWSVIDRLASIDEKAGPLVRRLGTRVQRFASYRPRLGEALRLVTESEREWFTSPRCDSYHTVWMQLHEDLLVALGIERGTEHADKTP